VEQHLGICSQCHPPTSISYRRSSSQRSSKSSAQPETAANEPGSSWGEVCTASENAYSVLWVEIQPLLSHFLTLRYSSHAAQSVPPFSSPHDSFQGAGSFRFEDVPVKEHGDPVQTAIPLSISMDAQFSVRNNGKWSAPLTSEVH
jgi:hypothetical protein